MSAGRPPTERRFGWLNRPLLLRIFISASLLIWLLLRLDLNELAARWRDINWLFVIPFVPLFYLGNITIRVLRLRLILGSQGFDFRFRWLWLVQLRGAFLVSFLPGGLAGDIYRTYAIGKKAHSAADSIISVLLEKVIGLAAMMLLSAVALSYGLLGLDAPIFSRIAPPIFWLAGSFIGGCLAFVVMIRLRLLERLSLPLRAWTQVQAHAVQLAPLFQSWRLILALAGLSFTLQVSVVLWYFTMATALQLAVPLLVLLIVIPLVELLLILPISVGGLGLRDNALVLLLMPFGIPAAASVSLSLLVAFTVTIARALSGLAFFFNTGLNRGPVADMSQQGA